MTYDALGIDAGELAQIGAGMSEPMAGATGLHAKEDRAKYQGRATANAWWNRYLYRIEDDRPMSNPFPAAAWHRERFARSRDGGMIPGSWEHLTDIEFRDYFKDADREEQTRLLGEVIRGAAAKPPPSRTTAWRQRQRAEQQAA